MIDRSKPLTEQSMQDLRVFIDSLRANRERYDRASRIVEVRSCDLEIADATRALAIINRRATEAEDQRAAEGRALTADEIRDVVLEAIEAWTDADGSQHRVRAANQVAEKLAGREVDPEQRETDLREAFVAGKEWESQRWPDDERDPASAAAEYARSKAGG